MSDQAPAESVPEAAALVIRVWRETTSAAEIKARITKQRDLAGDAQSTAVVTSPEAVYSEVRAWLEEFVSRTGGGAAGQS